MPLPHFFLLHFVSQRISPLLACLLAGSLGASVAWAQGSAAQQIYRCGQLYTNQPDPQQNCVLLSGGNVTVIEGTRVQGSTSNPSQSQATPSSTSSSTSSAANSAGATSARVDATEQRQRDNQAQVVLQAELARAQRQHAELLREWNNGEPERRAGESRESSKYQERVAQLRDAVQRAQADVAGLQRELGRLSPK